jgi:CDP-diglyceride synthetase
MMHRLGRITTWSGVILTAIGLVGGFGLIWLNQHQLAKMFLMLTPLGFLLLLTGVATAFLSGETENRRNPE